MQYLQVRVQVSDRGIPVRTQRSSATIRINIIRNENLPSIENLPETVEIGQNVDEGTVLYTVFSEDDDRVAPFNETTYAIIGDDDASRFFSIDAIGVITLAGDLADARGDDVVYRVR